MRTRKAGSHLVTFPRVWRSARTRRAARVKFPSSVLGPDVSGRLVISIRGVQPVTVKARFGILGMHRYCDFSLF